MTQELLLSESVDRIPGKCLTFYARVKVQVKKNICMRTNYYFMRGIK